MESFGRDEYFTRSTVLFRYHHMCDHVLIVSLRIDLCVEQNGQHSIVLPCFPQECHRFQFVVLESTMSSTFCYCRLRTAAYLYFVELLAETSS